MTKTPSKTRNQQFNLIVISCLLSCIQIATPLPAYAESSKKQPVEKITIDADHMQLNIESGNSVYTGNVKITQGELILMGDKVTLDQKNNEVERITVLGKPAKYNHVTEKGEPIHAQSEHMVYIANQNKLIMTVNAIVKQLDHMVSSQSIIYDTQKGIIIAGDKNNSTAGKTGPKKNGTGNNQRVNITLTPQKPIHQIKSPPDTGTSGKK